jgi:hypothetical protein
MIGLQTEVDSLLGSTEGNIFGSIEGIVLLTSQQRQVLEKVWRMPL